MRETVAATEAFELSFSAKTVRYYFDAAIESLADFVNLEDVIFITDDHLAARIPFLDTQRSIVIPAGEQFKQQPTVDDIISQLIEMEATRQTLIIGVGGGVVTDITGYAASIYMRGLRFGFVPTTILAQVDASIGGKNGIDAGVYKNLVGIIRQPDFILFDHKLLQTLPELQWINGFAEIIKHAAIADREMFDFLEQHTLDAFRKDHSLLASLVKRNVLLKSGFV
ncbi:MAG: 3-dehydroquinate synthase family protein, partial [Chitinophagaceae bacterium]